MLINLKVDENALLQMKVLKNYEPRNLMHNEINKSEQRCLKQILLGTNLIQPGNLIRLEVSKLLF